MGYYTQQIVTEKGSEAIARTVAKQSTLTFTSIKTGAGKYSIYEISKLSSATELKDEKQTFDINSISSNENTIQLASILTNIGVTEAYEICEIGLFAKENDGEEFLAAISLNAETPALMPVFDKVPIEMQVGDFLTVSNSENFNIQYKSAAYVTIEEFNQTIGDVEKFVKSKIEAQELNTNVDANDIIDDGIYYCNYKKTYSNIPAANGWLVVNKVADNIVKQLFFRHGTANTNDYQTYVRTKIGTDWSDWTRLITVKDVASTSVYGVTKLIASVSNTSTALAATPSAVKLAYEKAVSAFSGKGLPYAIFDVAADSTSSEAWVETSLPLKLQKSGAGDRISSFTHGGSNFIYCPFSGIVDIDINVFATASINGYYHARCYQYNDDGSDELLDFTGLGGYTSAGCQGSGSMKVHVTAGTYIYINVAASTAIKAAAANSHIRLQYTMID